VAAGWEAEQMGRWNRFRVVPLLVLAMVFAGCDSSRDPNRVFEPEAASSRAPEGWSGLSKEDLTTLEKLERQRIKDEKERRKEEKKALKEHYDEYKRLGYSKKLGDSPLLVCEPRDYDAEVAIIGPDGGELKVGDHKLTIPEGALSEYTVITMEAPASLHVEVEFTPHGVHFDREPLLKLSYKGCYVPHSLTRRVVYLNDSGDILEWPTSVDIKHLEDVYAWIWHFSRYAVASN
jgi:hypothetical protein